MKAMQMTRFTALVGGDDLLEQGLCNAAHYQSGMTLAFEQFGSPAGGLYFSEHYIPPTDITVDLFGTRFLIRHQSLDLSILGELEIVKKYGYGHITLNGCQDYILKIEPWAPHFRAKVAANAGAVYNSETRQFQFDPTSQAWIQADWQDNQLDFSYDTYVIPDPFLPVQVAEAQFIDLAYPTVAPLTMDANGEVQMSHDDKMILTPNHAPPMPNERAQCAIHSVFPQKACFQFDTVGAKFHGAYQDAAGQVYAIQGEFYEERQTENTLRETFQVPPLSYSMAFNTTSGLDIYSLVSMNPVVADANHNLYDKPGRESSDDMYKLVLNAMDASLRETYYGGPPPTIPPAVQAIYNGDAEAPAFYRDLQLPMLAGSLGGNTTSKSPYVKQINKLRADMRLRTNCANNPVYKRQSDKLYRMHFLENFPSMQNYLNDQQTVDHTMDIHKGAEALRTFYRNKYGAMHEQTAQENLKLILKQLDQLEKWAIQQKFYWAFMLYYYLEKTYLPKLSIKMLDGALAENVSTELKNYSALFQMLETYANPEGITFNKAFMDSVMVAQLGTILPQMMDYKAHFEEYREVFESIMHEFITAHQTSGDPEIQKHMVELEKLLANQTATRALMDALSGAMTAAGTGASWNLVMQNFEKLAMEKLTRLSAFAISALGIGFASYLIVTALMQGSFQYMTPQEKVTFIATCTGLMGGLMFFVVRNIIRLHVVWNDISGFLNCAKVLLGSNTAEVSAAISRLHSSAAKFFLGDGSQLAGSSSNIFRILGRNVTKFACSTIGAVFAVISLITTALEIHNARGPVELAADIFLLAASTFQVIAVAMNFCLAAANVTVGILPSLCSCLGALGAVAAVVGVVLMLVVFFTQSVPADPVETFVKEYLKPAGLAMESGCALEYISVQANPVSGNVSGYSLESTAGKCLYVQPQTNGVYTLTLANMDYSPNAIWSVEADEDGKAKIYTMLDGDNKVETCYLYVNAQRQLCCGGLPKVPETREDGTYDPVKIQEYIQQRKGYAWEGECTEYTNSNGTVTVAKFALYNEITDTAGTSLGKKYLNLRGTVPAVTDQITTTICHARRLGVSQLGYYPAPFDLEVGGKDQWAQIYFANRKLVDAKWSTNPTLGTASPVNLQVDKQTSSAKLVQNNGATLNLGRLTIQVTATVQRDNKTLSNSCDVALNIVKKK